MIDYEKSLISQMKQNPECKECNYQEIGFGFWMCEDCNYTKWESAVNIDHHWKLL